ncbi:MULTISPECIES: lysophospholipid acyltransferase family protein [Cohnella]|uniref:lysophospholipid acyltransferase family protein n=1 Tax=Cohnella TaxID=329857 RepID=UPI0009BB7374|nr:MULTISPECIES: lysophospholipid acyltransferase family protein [Cohnella]MBN2984335.1 1-acyl-sn-glycerol-3-phosphate acyltransferase [Cohnella algarum]
MLYRFSRALLRVLFAALYRFEARGIGNVPLEGPVILASNHKSVMDPIALGIAVPRQIHFMAKSELFGIPLFGGLIRKLGAFPVKRGGVSKEAIRNAIDLLQDGRVMAIFPQGTRNEDIGMGKRGAVTMALRSDAKIVPVALIGNYRLFRKMIAVYGTPIDLKASAAAGVDMEAATEDMMSRIREMASTGRPR